MAISPVCLLPFHLYLHFHHFLLTTPAGPVIQNILVSSQLPADRLGWIWSAAKKDTSHPSFSFEEFCTAMHLVNILKSKAHPGPVSPNVTGPRPIVPQASIPVPGSSPAVAHAAPAGPPGMPTQDDLVTMFNRLRGDQPYITGEAASTFLERYRLPSDVLADIWDLSDMDSDGNLDKDEFLVAMSLVYTKIAAPAHPVPKALPDHLVPASKRHLVKQTLPHASPPSAPSQAFEPNRSAFVDLLSLDMPSTSDPVPPKFVPQQSGLAGSFPPPAVSSSVPAFSSPANRPLSPLRSTFKPTSSFGQEILSQHNTGSQTGSYKPDPGADSRAVPADTATVASVNSDINLMTQRTAELRATKDGLDRQYQQANSEVKILRLRLSQLRSQFETEEKHVKELRHQAEAATKSHLLAQQELTTLVEEHNKLQSEQSALNSQLGTLRAEHSSIKDNIRRTAESISQLRADITKKKADVRTQTGLNSVLSTQLSSSEQDAKRLQSEFEQLSMTGVAKADTESNPGSTAASLAGNVPSSSSPGPSMNPFRRRAQQSSDGMNRGAPSVNSEGFSPALSSQQPIRHQSPFESAASQAGSQVTAPTTFASAFSLNSGDHKTGLPPALQAQNRPGSRNDSWNFQPNRAGSSAGSHASGMPSPGGRGLGETAASVDRNPANDGPQALSRPPTDFSASPDVSGLKAESSAKDRNVSAGASSSGLGPDLTGSQMADPAYKSRFQYDKFEAEFPPIQPNGDDDQSSDSSFEGGFDDDFAPPVNSTNPAHRPPSAEENKSVWPASSSGFSGFPSFDDGNSKPPAFVSAAQSGVPLGPGSSIAESSKPAAAAATAAPSSSIFDDLKPAVEISNEEPSAGHPFDNHHAGFDASFDSPPSSRSGSRVGSSNHQHLHQPQPSTQLNNENQFDVGAWPLSLGNPNAPSKGLTTSASTQQPSSMAGPPAKDVSAMGRAGDDGEITFPSP